jgi:hypothetical protein
VNRSESSGSPDPCTTPYLWVCGTDAKGTPRSRQDPTGSMGSSVRGEVYALRILEENIRRATLEELPSKTREAIDEETMRQIYIPARTSRLREGFRHVRNEMLRFIEEQPERTFSATEKKTLRARLKAVKLELPPDDPYRDEPELYTRNDAFYERLQSGRTRLRIGGAYLHSSKSWFNLVFTLSHELAHAIDPCELRAIPIGISAYDRLTACFLATGVVASRAVRSECGENDQLAEAFSDWLALRITSRALRSYSREFSPTELRAAAANAVVDLCDEEDSPEEHDDLLHPAPRIRIDRIFGRNPEIREILGCSSRPSNPPPSIPPHSQRPDPPFCDFDWKPSAD